MKKPYLKKYAGLKGFTVWIVDGKYIRSNLDEEFTNCGQHYGFRFIPKNEFWIDRERASGEEKYYIDSMLSMNYLKSKGVSQDKAVKISDALEIKERRKSKFFNNLKLNKKKSSDVLHKIHLKLLYMYPGKIKVWMVNGEIVRDIYFIDFTEGGHDKLYKFIPKNEIWIDNDISDSEINFILLHELHERYLMSRGWNYERAHKDSSSIEYYCRNHPRKLNACLREEIRKNDL